MKDISSILEILSTFTHAILYILINHLLTLFKYRDAVMIGDLTVHVIQTKILAMPMVGVIPKETGVP